MAKINPINPYKNVVQYTKVSLEPHQMNSDISIHLKANLKKKVEKKCNKNGFVDQVYKILTYGDGIMKPENLSGNVLYDIKYHCKLCLPIENSIIISQVKIINPDLVITINGPILNFIPREHIDTSIWNVFENFKHNNIKNTNLKIKDYVLVQILTKRINSGDSQIKTICKLLDFASEDHIKEYFQSNDIDDVIDINTNETDQTESNFII
jgi:DNA-directed RNA polymerase subunit E'/Rpb7